jgi:hypothetical protein
MSTPTRRATARLTFLVAASAVLLTATGSSLAIGARVAPGPRAVSTSGAAVPVGSIVKVDVTSRAQDQTTSTASGYGVIVDPSGLILASAALVAPTAPGVRVHWANPFIGDEVVQIVVNTSTAEGQPFAPAYGASVVSVEGLLDAAILQLDGTIDATGGLTPVTPGSLNLPSVPLATVDPAPGTPVTFATFSEAGPVATGAGTYTEIAGTVTSYGTDIHVPTNSWLITDIVPLVALPGGPIVDASGSLVAFATWLSFRTPANASGPVASLLAPVIAAAKSGTPYVSPYLVPGTGAEQLGFTGWSTTDPPCPNTAPATSYATGITQLAPTFSYSGITDGEDYFDLWYDPEKQQILTYGTGQWTLGSDGECYYSRLTNGGSAFPDGQYSLAIYLGGDLHGVAGADVTVGQPAAGAVPVTGRVVDADTGQPIFFVFVYILKPGTDPQGWWQAGGSDADVASSGLSGEDGTYTTDPPILPGEYPFVVIPFDNHQAIGGTATIPADGKMPDIKLVASE